MTLILIMILATDEVAAMNKFVTSGECYVRNKRKRKGEGWMKKLTVALLIATMSFSMMACGDKTYTAPQTTTEKNETDTQNDAITEGAEIIDKVGDAVEDTVEDGVSVATTLVGDFKDKISANAESSAQELADGLLGNSVISFQGQTMPVEPGLLNGFGNTEIKGFKEGVMFSPTIGSIPFVGYVFTLEDGEDVEAFKKNLKDNADPRWNVCTEADETVVESSGNTVFFLMSPKSFEDDM